MDEQTARKIHRLNAEVASFDPQERISRHIPVYESFGRIHEYRTYLFPIHKEMLRLAQGMSDILTDMQRYEDPDPAVFPVLAAMADRAKDQLMALGRLEQQLDQQIGGRVSGVTMAYEDLLIALEEDTSEEFLQAFDARTQPLGREDRLTLQDGILYQHIRFVYAEFTTVLEETLVLSHHIQQQEAQRLLGRIEQAEAAGQEWDEGLNWQANRVKTLLQAEARPRAPTFENRLIASPFTLEGLAMLTSFPDTVTEHMGWSVVEGYHRETVIGDIAHFIAQVMIYDIQEQVQRLGEEREQPGYGLQN